MVEETINRLDPALILVAKDLDVLLPKLGVFDCEFEAPAPGASRVDEVWMER